MSKLPIFLSVICVLRNCENECELIIEKISNKMSILSDDYEIIIIDNSSSDSTINVLKKLTEGTNAVKNLQIYSLTSQVDETIAAWAGIENSLGDYVITLNPETDDIDYTSKILDQTITNYDITFIKNNYVDEEYGFVKIFNSCSNIVKKFIPFSNIKNKDSSFRILSRKVVNFLLNYPRPTVVYSNLASITGFSKKNINYNYSFKPKEKNKNFIDLNKKIIKQITKNHLPIRLASLLMFFGSIINLLYSFYVVMILIFKSNVAPGWTTLSLQQSGMFFLISLVLFIICEYLSNLNNLSNEGPLFYIGQEYTSENIQRLEKLNVEDLNKEN